MSNQYLTVSVKFYYNLTVTDISCADAKLNKILHLLHGGPDVRGPGSKPLMLSPKSGTAVQPTSLQSPCKLLMTLASYNKITLHTEVT